MSAAGWLQLSLASAGAEAWPELAGEGPSLRAAWVWAALLAAAIVAGLAVALGRRLGVPLVGGAGAAADGGQMRVLARRRLAPSCELAVVEVGAAGQGTKLLLALSPKGPEVLRELPSTPLAAPRRGLEALR